jgi:hypothetical protein
LLSIWRQQQFSRQCKNSLTVSVIWGCVSYLRLFVVKGLPTRMNSARMDLSGWRSEGATAGRQGERFFLSSTEKLNAIHGRNDGTGFTVFMAYYFNSPCHSLWTTGTIANIRNFIEITWMLFKRIRLNRWGGVRWKHLPPLKRRCLNR